MSEFPNYNFVLVSPIEEKKEVKASTNEIYKGEPEKESDYVLAKVELVPAFYDMTKYNISIGDSVYYKKGAERRLRDKQFIINIENIEFICKP